MKAILFLGLLCGLAGCGNVEQTGSATQSGANTVQMEMIGFEQVTAKACKKDSDCPLYHVCASGRCYAN